MNYFGLMTEKRANVPSWEETFMDMARIVSKRSKDPSTQVGACIVGNNNIILALGYNGFPRGCSDDEFPWGKDPEDDILEHKYMYVVHAEANAILNTSGASLKGSTLYVTMFPCNECAKLIIQSGIKKVITARPTAEAQLKLTEATKKSRQASIRMFRAAGVEFMFDDELGK